MYGQSDRDARPEEGDPMKAPELRRLVGLVTRSAAIVEAASPAAGRELARVLAEAERAIDALEARAELVERETPVPSTACTSALGRVVYPADATELCRAAIVFAWWMTQAEERPEELDESGLELASRSIDDLAVAARSFGSSVASKAPALGDLRTAAARSALAYECSARPGVSLRPTASTPVQGSGDQACTETQPARRVRAARGRRTAERPASARAGGAPRKPAGFPAPPQGAELPPPAPPIPPGGDDAPKSLSIASKLGDLRRRKGESNG